MLSNSSEMKGVATRRAWHFRRVAMSLLLALLTLGFVGVSTGLASSSTPQRPATVSTQRADSAPALIAYNGTIYVGWTGRNAAHNMNLMTYNPTTKTFGPALVLTDRTLVGAAPSLAIFNGNLCVAWMGSDHHLNIGFFKPGDPTHLANKVTLSDTSNTAPSIAVFSGRLYMSWRGTDGRLNIISSADASTFNTKVTYNIAVRTSPTVVAKNYLFVAWEDMSSSSSIVFAQYNPANPSVLNTVVTVASTSQLPVGLFPAGVPNPYLRVAWRTATDTHIRLAVFEGGQYLHNPVYMTDTTLYGPALYAPYLAWTGTDPAQSINVSQVNI